MQGSITSSLCLMPSPWSIARYAGGGTDSLGKRCEGSIWRPAQRSVGVVLAALLLTACEGGLSSTTGSSVTAVPTSANTHREKVLIQYGADDTGSYPRDNFRGANQLIAQSLIKAVAANPMASPSTPP